MRRLVSVAPVIVGRRQPTQASLVCAVLVVVSITYGCTSGHSVSAPGSGSSASTLVCKNRLAPVSAPSTVRRLDHSVVGPDPQYGPPPAGDPAIDAIAAPQSVQVHHAQEPGHPLVA